jgi:Holliday junction resolvase RusA-like endonuclease
MLSRKERIDRKCQVLEQLDPEREVKLESTYTKHVADAIRASSPTERQQDIDNATKAYEDALDGALYEIVDKHLAAEGSSVS